MTVLSRDPDPSGLAFWVSVANTGGPGVRVLDDEWTAVTVDGSDSAHFEHTVAVTKNGPWILTRPKEAAGPVW